VRTRIRGGDRILLLAEQCLASLRRERSDGVSRPLLLGDALCAAARANSAAKGCKAGVRANFRFEYGIQPVCSDIASGTKVAMPALLLDRLWTCAEAEMIAS